MRTLAAVRQAIFAGIVFMAACGGSELDDVDALASSTAPAAEATGSTNATIPHATTPDQNNVERSEAQSLTPPVPEALRCKKKGSRCSNPFECCSLSCGFFNTCG